MSLEIMKAPSKKVTKAEPQVTYVQKVIGNDTYMVMAHSAVQLEDEFANLYYTAQNQSNIFLQPPFNPIDLKQLVITNNVLAQCVEAMEVNIDGTGFELVPSEEAKQKIKDEKEAREQKKKDKDFKDKLDQHQHTIDTQDAHHSAAVDNFAKEKESANAPPPKTPTVLEEGQTVAPPPPPKSTTPEPVPPIAPPAPEPPEEPLGDGMDDKEKQVAQAFFNEPYPGVSFITMRRKLRREVESIGYAYLEILRNMAGDVVGCRNIETHNVRMVKLDAPVLVKKTINRNGKEIELQVWERERRFAQRVALKQLVYYREFGTTREVNRNTGHWEDPNDAQTTIAPEDRATELLIFGVHPDIQTPYFVPRWINQLPSVVGSRKAEELNLEFLDSGGMPPAIIFIQGGTLAKDAADQLRMYLSGKNKNKHRAVVVEAQSSSGSLESAGSVQVKVERFGAERAMDAMFQKYDSMTEEHVRIGFRMPPLFLGKAADYNFATARTAYMVAEEQVFQPERTEFDERMNMTIIKALGLKTVCFKSLPITLSDLDNQIKTLTLVKDAVTRESLVEESNKLTGLSLDPSPDPQPDTVAVKAQQGGLPGAEGAAPPAAGAPPAVAPPAPPPFAKKSALDLVNLATDYAAMKGLTKKRDFSHAAKSQLERDLESLTPRETHAFNTLLASLTYGSSDPDLVHIAGHAHKH